MNHANVKPNNRIISIGKHEQSFEMWSISPQFVLVPQLPGDFTDTFIVENLVWLQKSVCLKI